jgi:hypothetical protein
VHIARATGKDDSEDGSSDENSSKKDKKRQGAGGAANKSGPNKASMHEVKEATQESSPDVGKRGAGNPATR